MRHFTRRWLSVPLSLSILALSLAGEPARAECAPRHRTPACGDAPSALFDREGQLWVVYADGWHVYLSRSADQGVTFAEAVKVNREPEAIYADGENRPALAFGREGEVFVAWTRRNSAAYGGDIRFTRSLDGGRRFEEIRTVNDDGLLTSHRFVAMAATAAGPLYLAWLDKRDQVAAQASGEPYVGAALYYTVSRDGGRTFAANRKVADNSCECCRLALAPAGAGKVRVFWRHVFEQGSVRDHAIATLDPENATTALRATRDNWRLDGCPHHGPALAAAEDGSGHHMAWFSNGENGRGILYGFHDPLTGQTTRSRTIDARPNGGHPSVAARGSDITLVWLSFDGSRMNVMMTQSTNAGRHWSEARVLASTEGASDHPLLLRRGDSLYLSWHTVLDGYRLLPVPSPAEESLR